MLKRLSTEKIERLHSASLEVLEKTGVRLLETNALDRLRRAGCSVDGDGLVRFPPRLVEWALAAAPRDLTLHDQVGEPAIELAGRTAYYGNGSDLLWVIDHRTGQRRQPVLEDVRETITVLDALQGIDFVMSGFLPSDVPAEHAQTLQMLTMLEHTDKPIVYVTTDLANTRRCVDLAETVAGGGESLRQRPFAVNYVNISNPLRQAPESIEKLMWLAARGLPLVYRPSIVTRGISTPLTWAGFLVVNNVAGLAGLVLAQLVREGTPFIRCGHSGGTFDMRTMVGLHAAPEVRGFNEDLAEYYGLPRFGIGGLTGSNAVDQQAAYEAALTLQISALAGAQLIHDVGYMDNGTTGALDQLVICHEILGWVKQCAREMVVDEETLALDVIEDVVREDTDFLQSEHTLEHLREDYYPELTDRQNFEAWEAAGGSTLRDRAREKVDDILRDHTPRPKPEDILNQLRERADRG